MCQVLEKSLHDVKIHFLTESSQESPEQYLKLNQQKMLLGLCCILFQMQPLWYLNSLCQLPPIHLTYCTILVHVAEPVNLYIYIYIGHISVRPSRM